MSDNDAAQNTNNTDVIFDGLCCIGTVHEIRELRRSKGDNSVIEGMVNVDFATSRGIETIQAQKVIKTAMGSFDKTDAFNALVNGKGRSFIVTVGKVVAGAFTNYLALDVKEY